MHLGVADFMDEFRKLFHTSEIALTSQPTSNTSPAISPPIMQISTQFVFQKTNWVGLSGEVASFGEGAIRWGQSEGQDCDNVSLEDIGSITKYSRERNLLLVHPHCHKHVCEVYSTIMHTNSYLCNKFFYLSQKLLHPSLYENSPVLT